MKIKIQHAYCAPYIAMGERENAIIHLGAKTQTKE